MTPIRLVLASALTLAPLPAFAAKPAPATHPVAEAQALELGQRIMAMRSVRGPGNETPKVAAALRDALVAGGFAATDIEIVPVDDTAYLVAQWKGSDSKLKPLILSGHMDVVEAKRADWQRDPFVPVIEDGYLYGRGATDMKIDVALMVSSLIELKRQGYRPKRTIVLALSGDEETLMKTGQMLAERFAGAEMVLNADFDTNGLLDEATGKPLMYDWQGAEKAYADFELEVTNPGGHSSKPSLDNAIVQLSQALVRIGAYRFKPEVNDLTRAYFETSAPLQSNAALGAAMLAFAKDQTDADAIAALRKAPLLYGMMGTTCIPTTIVGGHAVNAQPQRVTAVVNCRIFPGHTNEEIMAELKSVAAVPQMTIRDMTEGAIATAASPLRPDVKAAIERSIHKVYPGIPVIPAMSLGASDNMWYRHKGVPSYVVSPLFIKPSDYHSHGLNEKVPLANIPPAITYYTALVTDLSR
ncbi:MAG: M20/M25/M40 family metallo-hydrolase [Novosphingobium sp.]|uniref:M20/M25/M40 family metallo-hydrolase n=1 Tax=Novosphingobium sp. TaxID=1874826 RepID=UPI003015EA50